MRWQVQLVFQLLIGLLVVPIISIAQTENQDYLPFSEFTLNKKFPLEYVGTLGFSNSRPPYMENTKEKKLPTEFKVGSSIVTFERDEKTQGFIFYGKDKKGKSWSVNSIAAFYDSWFYRADLDRNGQKDLIAIIPTGGNGLAPTTHFWALTFDIQGRPIPFQADGYFEPLNQYIFDLVDLDNDGRAELIYMTYDCGYWITELYKVKNARWQKTNSLGRWRFPLYTRFTDKANHKATFPKVAFSRCGRLPYAAELSNNSADYSGILVSYQWADINYSKNIALTLVSKKKQIEAKPISWFSTFSIITDTSEGRNIYTLNTRPELLKSVFNQIVNQKLEVHLYGRRDFDFVSPELLWANSIK